MKKLILALLLVVLIFGCVQPSTKTEGTSKPTAKVAEKPKITGDAFNIFGKEEAVSGSVFGVEKLDGTSIFDAESAEAGSVFGESALALGFAPITSMP